MPLPEALGHEDKILLIDPHVCTAGGIGNDNQCDQSRPVYMNFYAL